MNSNWEGVRPAPEECGDVYHTYINTVGAGNIIDILLNQMQDIYMLIHSLTPEQASFRYAEEKWTVKEVIGHLIDTERIFATRCLHFSREDAADLPGFDQDEYVRNGNFSNRSLQSLGNEYSSLRDASVYLFRSFTREALDRTGTASGYSFTVRSIPFIIAGHERHHLNILKTKYGVG